MSVSNYPFLFPLFVYSFVRVSLSVTAAISQILKNLKILRISKSAHTLCYSVMVYIYLQLSLWLSLPHSLCPVSPVDGMGTQVVALPAAASDVDTVDNAQTGRCGNGAKRNI